MNREGFASMKVFTISKRKKTFNVTKRWFEEILEIQMVVVG